MPTEDLAAEHTADPPEPVMTDNVIHAHRNRSHWYNNASFSLPLLGAVTALAIGFLAGSDEAKGFGLFLLVVSLLMAPVVLWSWRATPTAILVTQSALVSLHGERELRRLPWQTIVEIERKETMGNLRWRVLDREGDHVAIEGEIEDVAGLIAEIKRRSSGIEEEVAD